MYWITWRVIPNRVPLPAAARDLVAATLRYLDGKQYTLVAYVVMDDHVHVITHPLEGYDLAKIVQAWKSVSAHRVNKALGWTGTLWLPEYFDRIVRDEDELYEKCQYILNNPLKRWPDIRTYKWVYCLVLDDTASGGK